MRRNIKALVLAAAAVVGSLSFIALINYQQAIADFVLARVKTTKSAAVEAALTGVTLNSGTTSVALGTDVTSQTTALSPDIGAYTWTASGTNFMTHNIPGDANANATDLSGYGQNMLVAGGTAYAAGCQVGGCFTFDGTDDHLRLNLPTTIKTANITMEAWVNTDTIGSTRMIVAGEPRQANAVGLGAHIALNASGNPYFTKGTGSAFVAVIGTTTLSTGTWYHVVGTFDGSSMKIYVNGVLENTNADATAISWTDGIGGNYPDPAQLYIGAWKSNIIGAGATIPDQFFFDGRIDEVRIYPRALSAAQIAQNYADGNAGLGGPTIIQSEETTDFQVWNLTVTPISSAGGVGAPLVSANTVTVGAGITLNAPAEDDNLIATVGATPSNVIGYRWYLNAEPYMRINLPFNSGTPQTDISGNSNNMTVSGATYVAAGASCQVGGCMSFDGDDNINISSPGTAFDFSSFSTSFWVKTSSGGGVVAVRYQCGGPSGCIAGPSGSAGDHIFIAPTYIWVRGVGFDAWAICPSVNDGAWHHMVTVRDASNGRLAMYKDGVLCHENDLAGSNAIQFSSNVPFSLGAYYNNPSYTAFFTGSIDEFQIIPRAITSSQVARLYADGTNATATLRGGPTQITEGNHVLGDIWNLDAAQVSSTVGSFVSFGSVTVTPAAATTTVGITTPSGTQNTLVPVSYSCQNGDSEPRDILVEYSTNGGGSFAPAALRSVSSGTISGGVIEGVNCASGTSSNSFVWDSVRNNVASGTTNSTVRLRVTAQLAAAPSASTTNFSVANSVINLLTTSATLSIGTSNTDYENEHIVCLYPTSITVDGTHTFASLVLENACSLSQTTTTAGTVIRTNITTTYETRIDGSSSINVSGDGFPTDYTSDGLGGATTTGGPVGASGGSHGGYGGTPSGGVSGVVYGNPKQPNDPGAGGGSDGFTSNGGGAFRLTTADLYMAGTINADGLNTGGLGGVASGAGGSIWITVSDEVSVTGTIRAKGGAGPVNNFHGYGSGGRIAFYYNGGVSGNPSAATLKSRLGVESLSGSGGTNHGASGTIYIEDSAIHAASAGHLFIDNASVTSVKYTPIGSSSFGSVSLLNRAQVIGATVSITDDLSLTNTSILTHDITTTSTVYRLMLTVGDQTTIDATSSIDVSGRGFVTDYTSNGAGGTTTVGGPVGTAGGAHGGRGGQPSGATSGATYDSVFEPADPGGGGGSDGGDGSGGGYVKLVTQDLTVAGTINADSFNTVFTTGVATGAGGGIWIITTGDVNVTGTIKANSASGAINNFHGYGGGGRIAFYYDGGVGSNPSVDTVRTRFQAYSGSGAGGTLYGAAGTIYIENTAIHDPLEGEVFIANNNLTSSVVLTPVSSTYGDLTIEDAAHVTGTTIDILRDLSIVDTSFLTHDAATSSTVYRLLVTVGGTTTIDATSSINVVGKGFITDYTSDGAGGTTSVGGPIGSAGGSHGGRGGQPSGATSSAAYDSIFQPADPGGGAGTDSYTTNGGGYVKLVSQNLALAGSIDASGLDVSSLGGVASGAGGGIWIVTTGTVSVTGTIKANGGAGTINNFHGYGGGGRIAFYYDSAVGGNPSFSALKSQVQANSSSGAGSTLYGAAGTIYFEDDALHAANQGILVVDNANVNAGTVRTPLYVTGQPSTYTFQDLYVNRFGHLMIDTPCLGTPALTVLGTTDLSNNGQITNNQSGTCTVSQPSINITTTSLPAGIVGVAYNQTIASTGGYGPHTFVCRNGGVTVACTTVLPPGLDMSTAGVITGTPTTPGTYPFTVRATEASPGVGTDDQALSIGVGNAPSAPTSLFLHNTDAQLGNTNPSGIDSSPVFSAIFNDSDVSDTAVEYRIQVASDVGFTTLLWDSGANGTALSAACAQGFRCANIAYAGSALSMSGVTYYWRIKYFDQLDIEGPFSATAQFTTSAAPTAPTSLFSNDSNAQTGLTNPVGILAQFPVFSAVFNDPDLSDTATKYRIQVDDNSNFSSPVWNSDSNGTNMPSCNQGARCSNIVFGGTALERDEKTYYWRIKFWDAAGVEGAWSEDPVSTNTFKMGILGSSTPPSTPPPQPVPPETPIAGAVEVLSSSSLRFNWIDVSNNENGFRLLNADGNVVADVTSGVTQATVTGLPANTIISGYGVLAYNSVGSSVIDYFDDAVTAAPTVRPVVQQRGGDSVTFTIEPPFTPAPGQTSAFTGQTAVQFEAVITSPDGTVRNVSSGFVQSNTYTFQGIAPEDDVSVRVITRNQDGLQNTPTTYEDVAQLSRRFNVSLGVFKQGTSTLPRPISAQDIVSVRMALTSVGTDPASSVTINMPLPRYIVYRPGTLVVDGRPSSDAADQQGTVANRNGVSASWARVNPGESHTVSFELAFDIEDLRQLSDTAQSEVTNRAIAAVVMAAANPLINLQASVSFAESDAVYMSPLVTLEPDVETAQEMVVQEPVVEPQPVEQPVVLPTPEETAIIEQILQQEFGQPTPSPVPAPSPSQPGQQPAPTPAPAPTLQTGSTNTSSDGGSFNIDVSGGESSLGLTGSASVQADQIQFTGTTSQPFTIITLIFNNSITAIVVSDSNGFWQTFVDADRLGIAPGQEARVTIEAIAAKGDLRSERVQVGDVTVSRGRTGDIVAEFDTTVSESPIISVIEEIQHAVVRVVEEQEPVIKTTLTVSAPVVIVSSAPLWGYLPYVPTLIYHLITQLFGLVGRKKRSAARFYGVAYDSISKQPLALAIIRIYKNETALPQAASLGAAAATNKKLVTTIVTDKQGRYDALLEPGQYTLEVAKPGYLFPSQIVTASADAEFEHVYDRAQGIRVEGDQLTIPDVPMDPINAQRQWQLAHGGKKVWLGIQRMGEHLAAPILIVGSIVSALVVATTPDKPSNWIIAATYITLLILQLRFRSKPQRAWGVVYDIATNAVLPLTALQLVEANTGKVVASRLSDYQGRFTFLSESGEYVLRAVKPGYAQVSEVVESPYTDRQPITASVHVEKAHQQVTGDIAMRQQG